MGQQQLLLLVLSTVIVGLATVAGIQAFSENQEQATQDALIQRAMSLGSDISAAGQQPAQMGGIDLTDSNTDVSDVASAIGLSDGSSIPADGAGTNAECQIVSSSLGSLPAKVQCDDDASYGSGQTITVNINPQADTSKVSVAKINVTS